MLVIPIRTEARIRYVPVVNYAVIGLNVLCFLLFNEAYFGRYFERIREQYLVFESVEPAFYQFFTYQFLHADIWHLVGNMLFLWVFGNGVNGKMGGVAYLLFYLAGGVFAAWGYALVTPEPFRLIGASGAIASITTAYLALFPRSRVTILVWFFFIHFFEIPAMMLIGLKIIVWDNIVAPGIGGGDNVAHMAHLAGYLFGFVAALVLLFVRAVPRDQFDILSLWKRWNKRREFASAMSAPGAATRAQFGQVGRVVDEDPKEHAAEEERIERIAGLRNDISEAFNKSDVPSAMELFQKLMAVDSMQCLPQSQQITLGRELYRTGRFAQAAAAFERFVTCYPRSIEANEVHLLLGIIYARDLRQYEEADKHLTATMGLLRDEGRRAQCLEWLTDVRSALGRPAPET